MANFDDIFVSQPQEETEGQSFTSFDKDEWAAQKKQERENAFALIDETAQHMTNDGELFQSYLDVQAHFDRYSVGNAILITAQKPDATQLADFKGWKDNGVYIKKGESGIVLLEPGEEYTKDDGSIGVSYNSKKVFDISYHTETDTETEIIESDDGNGNILEETVEVTKTTLYITVNHKTAEQMSDQYRFNEDQKAQVAELLAQDSSMWASVLYGIYGADDQIVAVALSQLGNVGGEPYWSWYGFGSRVEWCACFVSWCANQCGYIETGVIPKYAGCVNGVNWFKERGQWADNDIEPAPGMIIFFDWDNKGSSGPQDGESDHTGIVERVEDGIVYTVEGNSGDSCRENHYAVGYYEILGYGIPAY